MDRETKKVASKSKVSNFEDLNVYRRALELVNEIYEVSRHAPFSKDFALQNQVRRSAISVLSNIEEGFERGSKKEFVKFLFIAKGSCGEVRAQLEIAYGQKYLDQESYLPLRAKCRMISSMLHNFIIYLKSAEAKK